MEIQMVTISYSRANIMIVYKCQEQVQLRPHNEHLSVTGWFGLKYCSL